MKTNTWTQEETQWLIENYKNQGYLESSRSLNKPLNQIKNKVASLKLKLSPEFNSKLRSSQTFKSWEQRERIASKKIEVINKDIAYSLGMLWGDGHLRTNKHSKSCYMSLGILKNDYLEIHEALLSLGDWKFKERQRKERQLVIESFLWDGALGIYLQELGYAEKSKVDCNKVLEIIPEEFYPSFLQGYIDADGCFYINEKSNLHQFSLAGSYDGDWTSIENILNNLNIKYKIVRRIQKRKNGLTPTGSSIIRITGKINLSKLIEYIYPSLEYTVGLTRKYDKAMQIYNHFKTVKAKINNSHYDDPERR